MRLSSHHMGAQHEARTRQSPQNPMLWQMAGQDVHMMMPLQHCAVACMCCNDWRRTNDDGVGEGVAGHEVGLRCARHAAQHLPLAHRVLASWQLHHLRSCMHRARRQQPEYCTSLPAWQLTPYAAACKTGCISNQMCCNCVARQAVP